MNEKLINRIIKEAEYIIKTNGTVRSVASKFNISKSTIHKDLSVKLFYIDKVLYVRVRKILSYNLTVRHFRGGDATKNKYLKLKSVKKS